MVKLNEEKTKALERCNKCGFCLAHCPIYKVTGVEWTGARGRISLIRSALLEGKLDIKELNDPVFNCLTCNACVDDCPAGVQTADIIFSTREEICHPIRQPLAVAQSFKQSFPAACCHRFAQIGGCHGFAERRQKDRPGQYDGRRRKSGSPWYRLCPVIRH